MVSPATGMVGAPCGWPVVSWEPEKDLMETERRRSMDAEIASLKELLVLRCDGIMREVMETQRLQRETNGRLRMVEGTVADLRPRVSTLEREMGDAREQSIGENRAIKAWHIYYGAACIGLTVAVLKFFGKI